MAKKETGKQRRARLKAAHICTACGQRKARKKEGVWLAECATCAAYYESWRKKKAAKVAKKSRAPKRRRTVIHRTPVKVKMDMPAMFEPEIVERKESQDIAARAEKLLFKQ